MSPAALETPARRNPSKSLFWSDARWSTSARPFLPRRNIAVSWSLTASSLLPPAPRHQSWSVDGQFPAWYVPAETGRNGFRKQSSALRKTSRASESSLRFTPLSQDPTLRRIPHHSMWYPRSLHGIVLSTLSREDQGDADSESEAQFKVVSRLEISPATSPLW